MDPVIVRRQLIPLFTTMVVLHGISPPSFLTSITWQIIVFFAVKYNIKLPHDLLAGMMQ